MSALIWRDAGKGGYNQRYEAEDSEAIRLNDMSCVHACVSSCVYADVVFRAVEELSTC